MYAIRYQNALIRDKLRIAWVLLPHFQREKTESFCRPALFMSPAT